jgi:DNA (cytosine-5)-methyltransferase 1
MRYLSVCSGIEAATVAWHSLGWTPAGFAEIEPFPRAVLAHHYPEVPLHGDFTQIADADCADVDLLVGGTPCQSFSVAGLRGGLADQRGNLALEYLRLAERTRARWLVWENVPGVLSSNGGRDFGAILGGMVELGYGFAYRVLDAQYFGVPQRRRRVFVVGYLGDWRPAAAVLFERASLRGDSAPSRKARQVAPTSPARSTGGGGLGTDWDCDGGVVQVCPTLRTGGNRTGGDRPPGTDVDTVESLICTAMAFDTTQITSAANYSSPKLGDPCHPLAAGAHPPAVALQDVRAMSKAQNGCGWNADGSAYTVDTHATQGVATTMQVRRLTPVECERLQGFPDGYTAIPWRGKPADQCPDGPRYKALGNSMAVPCMRWIGERIAAVELIKGRT